MRHFYDLPQDDGSRRIHRCPPSHHEMALPPHLAQASARAPRPSNPTTDRTMSLVQVSPSQQRGSTMPSAVSPTPLAQAAPPCRSDGWMAPSPISFGASTPSYSPRCAVSSASMGGEYFPTARPNMPSVEVTRSGHPTAIVEWAACASAAAVSASVDDVLEYWMTYAHPHETALFKQQTRDLYCNISGSPLYPEREMRARRARWVCTYLAMSVSPSHPHHLTGGSPGPMAPSPADHSWRVKRLSPGMVELMSLLVSSHPLQHRGGSTGLMAPSPAITPQVSSPSSSMARPSTPARLTKTAPQQRLQTSSPPSHPHHHTGGSLGPMAPTPAITPQVSSPSPSKARPPTPARSTQTASPQQTQSSSSPSPATLQRGGASLAEHRAATVLQCWKRRIWLRRWFNQQALLKQKRLRLQALCRGASTYASSVRGNRRPPPSPTDKSSDPKVLNHPFRTRGQPLPPRKMRRRHKRPRRRPGRRHRPRAPNSGGGPMCMPMVFWAAQTMAAYGLLGVREPNITSYISPNSAASTIQYAYRQRIIRRNCLLLPCLRGPYTSKPGNRFRTDKWAATTNTHYRSRLASMHRSWATLPLADLVSYLSVLRGLDQSLWPPYSVDWDTFHRESNARHMVLELKL